MDPVNGSILLVYFHWAPAYPPNLIARPRGPQQTDSSCYLLFVLPVALSSIFLSGLILIQNPTHWSS